LPLHVACEHGASREVIEFLISAFPKGADQTDSKGKTPRSIVQKSKFQHKASMIEALNTRKALDKSFSAFYNEDEDASLIDQFGKNGGSATERSEILKNLSVSFANSEVDGVEIGDHPQDEDHDEISMKLKPTMGYGSKYANNNSLASRPSSQTDPSIWIGNCNTTSSLTDNDEGEERTVLCNLVSSMKWQEALERLASHPAETSMWWCKRDRVGQPIWQLLPIHKACELNPPPELVNALIHTYPEGVMAADHSGRLPIHLACCRGAPSSVITILLDYGGAASLTVKDGQGRLPLHVACVHGAAERVINMLIEAYPEGVEVEDNNNRTPMKIVQQSSHRHKRQIIYLLNRQSKRGSERSLSPGRSVGSMSLSKKSVGSIDRYSACSISSFTGSKRSSKKSDSQVSRSLIPAVELKLSLEQKDSQSTELTATDTTDSTGSIVESLKRPRVYQIVEKRRWEFIESTLDKYGVGECRVWFVKKDDQGIHQLRELALHRACQLQAPDPAIRLLIGAFAQGARGKTLEGKLPLHLACEFGSTHSAVQVLVDAYPDGVRQRDKRGKLPIHYACVKGCSVDVIKLLIRQFPASLDEVDNDNRSPRTIMNARYFETTGVKP